MIDIDKLRPEFMDLIANNFSGKVNINIPIKGFSKMQISTLYAEVSPLEIYKTSCCKEVSNFCKCPNAGIGKTGQR